MRKTVLLVFLTLVVSQKVLSQLTTNPVVIEHGYGGQITIVYDPLVGNGDMEGASKCYAHTGLITSSSESFADWKNVVSDWRSNTAPQLAKNGNVWELVIPNIYTFYNIPDTTEIKALAFVFNDGPNGTREGKTSSGNEFFIELGKDYSSYRESSFITIQKHTAIVEVGKSLYLSVQRDGNETLDWRTNNFSIAWVQYGLIKGINEGVAKISVAANNVSDTCVVTVRSAISVSTDIIPANSGSVQINRTNMAAQLKAVPNYGYHFVQWSDGNIENPHFVELTQDTSFTAEFAPNEYVITIESSNPEYGVSIGDTSVNYLEQVKISAAANYGYHFAKWQDGNTENPRLITVTKDAKYTAIFEKNTYNISKYTDYAKGYIDGPSNAKYLDQVTLYVIPNFGYQFIQWSDSINDNPRTFTITQDTAFTAEFSVITSGQCGDNLYWSYNEGVLKISGTGNMYNYDNNYNPVPWQLFAQDIKDVKFSNDMTSIGNYACAGITNLEHINIPTSVQTIGNYAFANINNRNIKDLVLPSQITSIGDFAFANNTYIEQIDFGKSVEYIGSNAFQNCSRVTTMTCLAEVTPDVGTDALASISNYAELYVLNSAIRKYQVDANWNRFLLKEIGAEETTMPQNTIIIVPTDNTATITWPITENADSYTIEITKDGDVFCTLTFNANGQLAGIAFAPNRNGRSHHTSAATMTVNGLQFTVTGLNGATQYGYNVTAKNASNIVASYSGIFTTTGQDVETKIDDVVGNASSYNKIIKNDQIYIRRGEKVYTVTGQEVK